MSQWQPIETAPKDGTLIDLWCDGFRLVDCWWQKLDNMGWICSKNAGYPFRLSQIHASPTYWMSIPIPVKE